MNCEQQGQVWTDRFRLDGGGRKRRAARGAVGRGVVGIVASIVGLAAAAGALVLALSDGALADSRNMPNFMQIRILNNETDKDLYIVVTASNAGIKDEFLRAYFDVPRNNTDRPYLRIGLTYRALINVPGTKGSPPGGIPPGGRITLQVPFFTQLGFATDGKTNNQFINWWAGGRVELFYSPKDTGPPDELKKFFDGTLRPNQTVLPVRPGAKIPKCQTTLTGGCNLTVYQDPDGQLPNNAQSQFVEYTLGALVVTQDVTKPDTLDGYYGAVDIDSSYVDIAFLPVALAPFNNKWPKIAQPGYVGSPQTIDAFQKVLQNFLKKGQPGEGWPQFKSIANSTKPILKFASNIHALTEQIDPLLMPPPQGQKLWTPIQTMSDNLLSCVPVAKLGTGTSSPTLQICQMINQVWDLFWANYDNYAAKYSKEPTCNKTAFPKPVPRTAELMVFQFMGFTPFTHGCGAGFNLLHQTPGYEPNQKPNFQTVKDTFDTLQYWNKAPFVFNPWVDLIHTRANIPNSYAYSVDDQMGNFQADGSGFYIAVGGTQGLPNPRPAKPPIAVAAGSPNVRGKFTHFGLCTDNPQLEINPSSPQFALYVPYEKVTTCTISFRAELTNKSTKVYKFSLKLAPEDKNGNILWPLVQSSADADALNPKFHTMINCDGLTDPAVKVWCTNLNYGFALPPRNADGSPKQGPIEYKLQTGGLPDPP